MAQRRHCLQRHFWRLRFCPPNLGLSWQKSQRPQSAGRRQAVHTPQRRLARLRAPRCRQRAASPPGPQLSLGLAAGASPGPPRWPGVSVGAAIRSVAVDAAVLGVLRQPGSRSSGLADIPVGAAIRGITVLSPAIWGITVSAPRYPGPAITPGAVIRRIMVTKPCSEEFWDT